MRTRLCGGGWLAAAVLACWLAPAAAQDTVTIAGSTGGRTRLTGRIIDYTGRQLRIELPGGREQSLPAAQVLQIETQFGPKQIEADKLFAKRRFNEALPLYEEARRSERRPWVQRQITAQIVWCHRGLGQPNQAGEQFLLLIRSDPDTPYFDCIPLAWISWPVASEPTARGWLNRQEPAAVLLGASHLMSTARRPESLTRLGQLAAGSDRRVAPLALAQTWRAEVVTAGDEQLAAWSRAAERMPPSLTAGPYFVLGLARAQRGHWERAALDLLRVPILYPQHRGLAAQSLLEAARALEKLKRSEQALRLYRELVHDYPETRAVVEAQARLEDAKKDPSP